MTVDYLIQGLQKVINIGNSSACICPCACHAMIKSGKRSMGAGSQQLAKDINSSHHSLQLSYSVAKSLDPTAAPRCLLPCVVTKILESSKTVLASSSYSSFTTRNVLEALGC